MVAQPARRNELGNHSAEQNYHASPNRLIVPDRGTCGAIEIAGAKIFPQGREWDGESRHRNYQH